MPTTASIERALLIEGWMSIPELSWLADQASRHSLIVEVGSYHGRSTRALGDNTPGRVIAVDTWIGPLSLASRDQIPSFEKIFRTNLADLLTCGKVIPCQPQSQVFENLHPDMVFIDGDHHYDQVKRDIIFWLEKLHPGSLLCGHDFSCLDVARAVGELIRDPQPVLGTDIWFAYV